MTAAPVAAGQGLCGFWSEIGLSALSFLLTLPLFAPWSWWPFGYVAFAPWAIGVVAARRARSAYVASYLLGAAFFLFHFRWLIETTPEGYAAASLLYLAPFFPLAAWIVRHAYIRRHVPLVIAFPIVWTGLEVLRAHNPLGFPWFFLGHSQIRLLPMVQIADLAGVYGVTFIVAAVNGLIADLWLRARMTPAVERAERLRPMLRLGVPGVVVLIVATLLYGRYRLGQSQFTPGPLTAVIQGDFLLKAVVNDPTAVRESDKERAYLALMERAIAEHPDIDLVVFPETPWTMYLNKELQEYSRVRRAREQFARLARETGKSIVVGAMSEEPQPAGHYPSEYRYNSAYLYTPGEPEPQRYDKIHLVPFGEYVPFRFNPYLHWLYRLLNDGPWNPWGQPLKPGGKPYEYSLVSGKGFVVMQLPHAASGQDGRFGITICYEDVVPQVFRKFVANADGTKRVDFMVNISNDGWFGYGNQQVQHLVNCAFRAIENRVSVARSANTGVSGFVDPDGRLHDLMAEPGQPPKAGGLGYRVARMNLDSRVSVYSIWGDVFGFCCLGLVALAGGDAVLIWRRRRSRRTASASQDVPPSR